MVRSLARGLLTVLFAVAAAGCIGRDPLDPSSELIARDLARPSRAPASGGEKLTCRCDAEGGLHIRAPEGSTVRGTERAGLEDAEAEITLPEDTPSQPMRHTKSLGFIGDNKLTETPPGGGSWNYGHGGGYYGGGYHGGGYYGGGYGRGYASSGRGYSGFGGSLSARARPR